MLKPAKSPLDTYTKTHESMEPWVMLDHFGTGIDIEESFVATYTLKVRQHFSWDGEKFTLSQITPNDGLVEEYKACKRAWEGEEPQFSKFALVPAGGTLGLLLSDDEEQAQALFNHNVTGDVSYELDGRELSETEGEQMRRQIVSELGKQVEVNVKWIKIGKP